LLDQLDETLADDRVIVDDEDVALSAGKFGHL
jgi:hypothetical protein